MKKNILNRAMFRQVKSPAYGTGISANLVSDEQRQRYNYGGRVRAANGLDYRFYTPIGGYPDAGTQYASPFIPKTLEDQKKLERMEWQYPKSVKDIDTAVAEWGEVDEQVPWQGVDFDFGLDDTVEKRFQRSEEGKKLYRDKLMEDRRELVDERKSVGLYTPGEKGHPSEGIDARWSSPVGVVEDDVTKEEEYISPTRIMKEKEWSGEIDSSPDSRFLKEDGTDELDPAPTAWETLMGELDKSSEEKKRLGRGNALMQAAAAAVEWSGAPTAEKRSAAISKGLTNVGTTAMKAAAEGMDLKNRAKILKGIEDVKGETDIKEQEMKGTQAMDRVQERIAYYKSTADKGDGVTSMSDTFKFTLADPKISNDPIASINALQTVAQGEDININTETLDMSQPESLKKKFPAGTIIRDTKPNGKWYIVGKDGIVDQTKQYTYSSIGDWVESQASDK